MKDEAGMGTKFSPDENFLSAVHLPNVHIVWEGSGRGGGESESPDMKNYRACGAERPLNSGKKRDDGISVCILTSASKSLRVAFSIYILSLSLSSSSKSRQTAIFLLTRCVCGTSC